MIALYFLTSCKPETKAQYISNLYFQFGHMALIGRETDQNYEEKKLNNEYAPNSFMSEELRTQLRLLKKQAEITMVCLNSS